MEDLQSLHGLSILCVEDNADVRDLMTWIFTTAGAEVKAAGSGREAMTIVAHWRPHILLTDLRLPDMDGSTLLRQIYAISDPAHKIPAIAITGQIRPDQRQEALAAGFQQFLDKPFDPAELLSLVAGLVKRNDAS